jgi:hypothetical protein
LARVALLTAVSVAILASGAFTASASAREFAFQASAFGTEAVVLNTVTSGPSAAAGIGCTSKTGITSTDTTASVNVPNVLSTGTISTLAASKATLTGVAATSSATTQNVNLLNGLITANTIKSVSTTSFRNLTGSFSVSGAGSDLVGLTINGHTITATPAPNTTISLPGIGYVVLNQQTSSVSASSASLSVIAIHVVVTATNSLAPAGTQLFVSVANSSLRGPLAGLLSGGSFGTSVNVANTVMSGPSFPAGLGCLGTGGQTLTNNAAGINIPGVLTSGTISDTAEGIVSATQVSGETSSTVQGLNLLNGLITAKVIKADVTTNGNPPTLGDKSSFLGLKVAGAPLITDNVPPNTAIALPGIGTLWLHRRIKTTNHITVIMIQVVVSNSNNVAHLPVGTVIDVADANVGVI